MCEEKWIFQVSDLVQTIFQDVSFSSSVSKNSIVSAIVPKFYHNWIENGRETKQRSRHLDRRWLPSFVKSPHHHYGERYFSYIITCLPAYCHYSANLLVRLCLRETRVEKSKWPIFKTGEVLTMWKQRNCFCLAKGNVSRKPPAPRTHVFFTKMDLRASKKNPIKYWVEMWLIRRAFLEASTGYIWKNWESARLE